MLRHGSRVKQCWKLDALKTWSCRRSIYTENALHHERQAAAMPDGEGAMDFPGGKVPFTERLRFSGGTFPAALPPLPCYQTIDSYGVSIPRADVPHHLPQDLALKMYKAMVGVQTMDTIFYESQRQVSLQKVDRISLWCNLEEMLVTVCCSTGTVFFLHDQQWGGSHCYRKCSCAYRRRHCEPLKRVLRPCAPFAPTQHFFRICTCGCGSADIFPVPRARSIVLQRVQPCRLCKPGISALHARICVMVCGW